MIREAVYKITENCPCNCLFCDSKEKYEKVLKKETMSYEEWKNITDKLLKNGLEVVVLSGGEALLLEDVTIKLINYLHEKGVYVVLNTCGILFKNKKLIEKVKDNYPDLLVFSVDSAYEEQHDNNRGMNGVFKEVINSIKYFKEQQGEYPLAIRTVITRKNYKQLPDIIQEFNNLGIDCIKFTNIENDVDGEFRLDINNLEDFDQNIRKIMIHKLEKAKFSDLELQKEAIGKIDKLFQNVGDTYKNLNQGYFSPNLVGNAKCDLDGHFFAIQSNGDILPCCEAEHHYYPLLGNLKHSTVEEIVESEEFKKFLNRRPEYCITCTQRHNLQINFSHKGEKVSRR